MSLDILGLPPKPLNLGFRTLELKATVAYDSVALGQIIAGRMAVHRAEAGPDSVRAYGVGSLDGATRSGDWERHTWRVWWTPPSFWREELSWQNGATIVIILRPDVASYYVSMQRTLYTSQRTAITVEERPKPNDPTHLPTLADRLAEFPLTGFRLPPADWKASTIGRESRLGRALRRVGARRRADRSGAAKSDSPSHWPWLDHFECLVDDDLGILLELIGLSNGGPVANVTADELRVDALIPEDVFSIAAPRGTRVVNLPRQLET